MLINQIVNNDSLSDIFAALSDPTRLSILSRLSQNSATVNELALPYDMSLPAISKHLKVLEHAGLISKRVDAQRRECHLEMGKLMEIQDWLESYREQWRGGLDSVADEI